MQFQRQHVFLTQSIVNKLEMKNMFKKMLACLTKIDKLGDILVEVQRGLIVCKTCLHTIKDGIRINAKVQSSIDNVLKYVDSASNAVGTILEWFGRADDVCTAEPRGLADAELAQITNAIQELSNKK